MTVEHITVALTSEQIEALAPMMGKVRRAADDNKPGMLLGQVTSDEIKVAFLSPQQGMEVQRIMRVPVGKTFTGNDALRYHSAMPGWCKVIGLQIRAIPESEGGGFAVKQDQAERIAAVLASE